MRVLFSLPASFLVSIPDKAIGAGRQRPDNVIFARPPPPCSVLVRIWSISSGFALVLARLVSLPSTGLTGLTTGGDKCPRANFTVRPIPYPSSRTPNPARWRDEKGTMRGDDGHYMADVSPSKSAPEDRNGSGYCANGSCVNRYCVNHPVGAVYRKRKKGARRASRDSRHHQ